MFFSTAITAQADYTHDGDNFSMDPTIKNYVVDLEHANKFKELSELKMREYGKILENAKKEVTKIHIESKNSLDKNIKIKKEIFEKEIEGFGELFRMISYKKIGTSSLQSRAIAGIAKGTFIFSIPGSPSACIDAWENILKFQLDNRFKPCNLIELIPRLLEK